MVNGLEVHHTTAGASAGGGLTNGAAVGSEEKVSQWQLAGSGDDGAISDGHQRMMSIGNQTVGINPKRQSIISLQATVSDREEVELELDVWPVAGAAALRMCKERR